MKHILTFGIVCLTYHVSFSQVIMTERTHYVLPEFTEGVVLMKNGTTNEVPMNYNSLSEEMIFEKNGVKLALGSLNVDTIFLDNRKFIPKDKKYVEILLDKDYELYVEYHCKLKQIGQSSGYGGTSQTTAIDTYSTFSTLGGLYELELPESYQTDPFVIYWIKRDGKMSQVDGMSKLKKLYADKKEFYKEYLKQHNVKFDDTESISQLVEFVESK